MSRQLRLVVFSESIVSDIGNATATTVRAMCQAFSELGHDVTHLERRGNPALTRMLQARGYAPMRAFNQRYPQIRYRQYDLPSGAERAVWFGREIATADAVVAYPGTPKEVVAELAARDNVQTLRFWIGAAPQLAGLLPLWTDPAVLIRTTPGSRNEEVVVAYDNIPAIGRPGWKKLTAGLASAPAWEFVPEVMIEEHYQGAVTVALDASLPHARSLLPVANGAEVQLLDSHGSVMRTIAAVPVENNARSRAERLVVEITRLLVDYRKPARSFA